MRHLFGPVPSRRLGMSLGIDLVPHKVCSFDCVYCECGSTTDLTIERNEYVKYDEVIEELKSFFRNKPDPDYFTFSGSGEPTLNSRIGEVIKYIKKEKPNIPVAVLTNGSLFYQKSLRDELLIADLVIPSLDATSEAVFQKINVPHKEIKLNSYIQGLLDFRKEYNGSIWLEIFILPQYNDTNEEILKLKETVHKLQPEKVQINTLDRPRRIHDLVPADKLRLSEILNILAYPNTKIISSATNKKNQSKSLLEDINTEILNTISRRPCTSEDIAKLLNMRITEVGKYIRSLESENKIKSIYLNRGIFYKIKEER